MIFKDGVVLALAPAMSRVLPDIDRAHMDAGIRRAVITSGNDGNHMAGSKHFRGMAVDLRTRDLEKPAIDRLILRLRFRLNGSETVDTPYDVVYETPKNKNSTNYHIHVEYDPK